MVAEIGRHNPPTHHQTRGERYDQYDTPIERSKLDIALELTQLHLNRYETNHPDQLSEVYAKYYALLEVLDLSSYDQLIDLLPDELKQTLE
ncbi:hypothetical protein [Bacillus pumilus]|uniref:hypothetical protein n=1 Tax=Bacillus pumilus TaxID=1408 RepID=UPI0021B390B3|nr:hypothetical protein [Bacillus pumilus]